MRVAFLWDWECDLYQTITWEDGLCAALQHLQANGHEIGFFTVGDRLNIPKGNLLIKRVPAGDKLVEAVQAFIPDVILVWGDCTRPHAYPLSKLGRPMAICFAGGSVDGPTSMYFDHFFVESTCYKERLEAMGKSVSIAFGTNEKLFTPQPLMAKHWDVCFPATYARWKRHQLFADAVEGLRAVCCGFKYHDHEQECHEYPRSKGVLTLPHVDPYTLRDIYAASRVCVITSETIGGSQRTVLEAMAMNVPLVVATDSDKTTEYLHDAALSEFATGFEATPEAKEVRRAVDSMLTMKQSAGREYVLSKWTAKHYADALLEGLSKIV